MVPFRLSDLAKYSMRGSVAGSLCKSRTSCFSGASLTCTRQYFYQGPSTTDSRDTRSTQS